MPVDQPLPGRERDGLPVRDDEGVMAVVKEHLVAEQGFELGLERRPRRLGKMD